MQGCARCALHVFTIIIDNMFSMTVFQQMANKCLEQAAFYNVHKGTFWAFRGNGQETYHFNKMLNISPLNKVQTTLWLFKGGEGTKSSQIAHLMEVQGSPCGVEDL